MGNELWFMGGTVELYLCYKTFSKTNVKIVVFFPLIGIIHFERKEFK